MKKSYLSKTILTLALLSSSIIITNNAKAATNKNSPYNTHVKSFKNNIDGFFTANTWYRPKEIHYDGKNWVKSGDNDYRPLLSVWWPNKLVKNNYINYMTKIGLGHGISSNQTATEKATIIQDNIEKKIVKDKSSAWLKKVMHKFINSQDIWNMKSESPLDINIQDGLQNGGLLLFGNNKLTPYANSKFRLLDRNGLNQNGHGTHPGNEFLLANDVDNSNPTVQSEDLNWLHYMMNLGTINHKKNANFDSIRIDATGNIDIDVNDIASSYFKYALGAEKNEAAADNHISINEAGQAYNKDNGRLKIDPYLSKYQTALTGKPSDRENLDSLAQNNLNVPPSYTYLNTHDHSDAGKLLSGLQIKNKKDRIKEVNAAIKKAGKESIRDENSANKQFSSYNIPSSYALILSDKNVVPRVDYGDLYSETSGFMTKKTPYFKAITSMMADRIKYVSGKQNKYIQNLATSNVNNATNRQVLVSVRNGKTRTQGMAVVLSNNPTLTLNDNDKIKVAMGRNHKNQLVRPAINTTDSSLKLFNNDNKARALTKRTDNNGDFYLTKNDIKGVNNPEVSGYLSVWVPVGAKKNQDARTKASKKRVLKNKLIYPGAALDSNLIFEGFSNFQTIDKHPDTYSKIAKNAKFLHRLGVTYYSFPPSYRSDTNDISFTDTIFENGYGIKDRYDVGYKTPTKYGTADQLMKAIQSLHKYDIKAMADYVPNQVYGLHKMQVVSTTRTDWAGKYIGNHAMKNNLYAAQSEGSGKDYQAKFGGKYLKTLKQKYPEIFKQKQISTNRTIDNSGKRIRKWSAKYLNGSIIQGRGSEYVLRDDHNGKYYKLGKDKYLPNHILH